MQCVQNSNMETKSDTKTNMFLNWGENAELNSLGQYCVFS